MTDLPKCGFCKKKFDAVSQGATNRSPILLRCGHTFCKHCVSKWAKGKQEVECFQCKAKTPCRDGLQGVQHLWPNMYIAGVLSCIHKFPLFSYRFLNFDHITENPARSSQRAMGQRCSECINSQATCRCIHCQVNMCKKCFGLVHSHSRFLRQHHSIPLRPSLITTECPIHCRLLEFFCEEDEIPICPECMISDHHKGHGVVRMLDKYKSLEEELKTAQTQTSSALTHTEKVKSMLKLELENVQYDAYQQADYIHQCFQDCLGTLQARFLGLLRELQTCAEKGCDDILELLREVEARELPIREAHADVELVLSNETCRQVVVNPNKILAVLRTSKYLPFTVETQRSDDCDGNNNKEKQNGYDQRFLFSLNPDIPFNIEQLGEIGITNNIKYKLRMLQDCPGLLDIPVQGYLVEDDKEQRVKPTTQLLRHLQEPHGKCQELVHVTFMENPSNFCVQRWEDKSHLDAIQRCLKVYKTRKPLVDEILTRVGVGDSCVAFYEPARSWYRGRITKILKPCEDENDDMEQSGEENDNASKEILMPKETAGPPDIVEVLYIDYGNTARTKVSCLRCLPDKLKSIPDLSIPCAMNNISPIDENLGWGQDVIRYFSKLIGDRPLLMTTVKREKGYRMVDLHKPAADEIDADVPTSVRDALVFLGLARLNVVPLLSLDNTAVTTRKFLTPSLLPVSTFISVVISEFQSLNRFCVQQMDSNMSYLTQLMTKIQSWVRRKLSPEKRASAFARSLHDLQILCPIEEMVCLAQYSDSKWYRAQVIKVNKQQTVDVLYVDYGDTRTVHFSKLLKIPECFTRLPVQALSCQLFDVSPLPDEDDFSEIACKRFAELCAQSQMLLEVRAVRKGIYYVDLYDYTDEDPSVLSISDRLYREGHIVRNNNTDDDKALSTKKQGADVSQPATQEMELDNNLGVTELLEIIQVPEVKNDQNMKSKSRVTNAIGPNLFYVQTEVQMQELNKMMLLLQEDMNEIVDFTADDFDPMFNAGDNFSVGDCCVVRSKMEKRWCRGQIQASEDSELGQECKVLLTDYGWVETWPMCDLKRPKRDYDNTNQFITKCSLGSVQPAGGSSKWTSTAVSLFRELVMGEECLLELMPKDEIIESSDTLPVEIWIKNKHQADSSEIVDYLKTSRLLELEGLALPVRSRRQQKDSGYQDILCAGATMSHHCFKPLKVRQTGEKIANPTKTSSNTQNSLNAESHTTSTFVANEDSSTSDDDVTVTLSTARPHNDSDSAVSQKPDTHSECTADIESSGSLSPITNRIAVSERSYSSIKILFPDECVPCFVSHIEDPCIFFVRLRAVDREGQEAVPNDVLEWQKIMLQIQDVAKNILAPLMYDDIKAGEPCLCRYIGDEKWHRAIILLTPQSPQSIPVQYVDFGTIENVPLGRLRRLPDCLLAMPIQAFMCQLVGGPVSEAVCAITVVEEFSRSVEGRELFAKVCESMEIENEYKHFLNMYSVSLFVRDSNGTLLDIASDNTSV